MTIQERKEGECLCSTNASPVLKSQTTNLLLGDPMWVKNLLFGTVKPQKNIWEISICTYAYANALYVYVYVSPQNRFSFLDPCCEWCGRLCHLSLIPEESGLSLSGGINNLNGAASRRQPAGKGYPVTRMFGLLLPPQGYASSFRQVEGTMPVFTEYIYIYMYFICDWYVAWIYIYIYTSVI